jgi:hypothetical protein
MAQTGILGDIPGPLPAASQAGKCVVWTSTGWALEDFWRTQVKGADQSGINGTATNITGLLVPVLAGMNFAFEADLWVVTSALTVGAMISCNGPAASKVKFQTVEWTSATVQSTNTQSAFNAFSVQTAGNGANARIYTIKGAATFTASGTFALRAKAEAGGTMTVQDASLIKFNTLN